MARRFDVQEAKKLALSSAKSYRTREPEVERGFNALGAAARSMAREAVRCQLVGLPDECAELSAKARVWVAEAIRVQERPADYADGATQAERHLTLAMCNWLCDSTQDSDNLGGYLRGREQFAAATGINEFPYLGYLDAEEYAALLAWGGDTPDGAAEDDPVSFRNFADEGRFACAVANCLLAPESHGQTLTLLAGRFLDRQSNFMLVRGDFFRLAQWYKVLVWKPSRRVMSAPEALMTCHEHLGPPRS